MNRLLSICIPTYGRPDLFFQTASELIRQARPYDIQIVISDNSEDDKTALLVADLKQGYPNIVYSRNEQNLGIDRNFLKVATMAETEFIWFFGDDDMPVDGAISRVLKEVTNANDIEFFLINSLPVSSDMKTELADNLTGIRSDKLYKSCTLALREVSWYSTFIGAFVVRREAWLSSDPAPFLDTVFVHVGIMFDAMARRQFRLKVISQPLIRYRTGNASWSSNFLNIQFILWKRAIDRLPDVFDKISRRIAVESVVERFISPSTLAGTRISGNLNYQTYARVLVPYFVWARKGRTATWRIALSATILVITPVALLKTARSYYRKMRYGA